MLNLFTAWQHEAEVWLAGSRALDSAGGGTYTHQRLTPSQWQANHFRWAGTFAQDPGQAQNSAPLPHFLPTHSPTPFLHFPWRNSSLRPANFTVKGSSAVQGSFIMCQLCQPKHG